MGAGCFFETMEKISYLGQEIVRWRVGQSTFLASPEKGARLMNWNVELGDGSVRDAWLAQPSGLALADGTLYFADSETQSACVPAKLL